MPIDETVFVRDMRGIIADQSIDCSFGAVSFTATKSETRRTNDVQAEGILNEADLEIMAVVADFTAGVPDIQEIITVDGTKYHVTERTVESFGVTVHFALRRI